jgi:hypothetical protein
MTRERPDVARRRRFALDLFGGHVSRSADDGRLCAARRGLPLFDSGDAEIEQHGGFIACRKSQHNVFGLEIAVEYQAVVGVADRLADLSHQAGDARELQAPCLHCPTQFTAFDVLHHEEGMAVRRLSLVENGDDVRGLEAGERIHFAARTWSARSRYA